MEGWRALSARERGSGDRRWWDRAHTVHREVAEGVSLAQASSPSAPGRRTVVAMMVLAAAVQLLVWGRAPTSGSGGAMLPGLRPTFGIAYGAVLLGLELAFCAYHGLRHGAAVVLVSAAAVDVLFWMARLGGLHFPTGAAAALTAGFGAVALGAGVLSGRLGADAGS